MADSTRIESAREVLARHKDEIMRTYQAVGVGLGKQSPTDQSYAIVVYLESARHRPQGPVSYEGIPVKFEVTGRIRPLGQ
jgi:hypothetical protein